LAIAPGWRVANPPQVNNLPHTTLLYSEKPMHYIDTVLLVFLGLAISYFLDAVFEISPRLAAWIDRELSD
jgi:hypothetical protein